MLLSVTQAADQTGVNRRRLLRAIAAGELQAMKIGTATASWVIDSADLWRWFDRQP